jgi:hypothetical protein
MLASWLVFVGVDPGSLPSACTCNKFAGVGNGGGGGGPQDSCQ